MYFIIINIVLYRSHITGVVCFDERHFFCDSSNCIPKGFTCDKDQAGGGIDCIDGTDEADALCTGCDADTEFLCNNGRCIDITLVCDGIKDCSRNEEGNSEDETNCQGTDINV